MDVHGNFNIHDTLYRSFFTGTVNYGGTFQLFDTTYVSSITGIVVGGYCYMPGDETFSMGQFVGDATIPPRYGVWGTGGISAIATSGLASLGTDPSIALYDSTAVGPGYWTTDGTYVDGTYMTRAYDPRWINYGIYYIAPPDRSDSTLVGYRFREPVHKDVGHYYASMEMPWQPGHYEIRWLEQKYDNTSAWEIRQRFTVASNDIVSFPDYS
jgi:hypothetical protein